MSILIDYLDRIICGDCLEVMRGMPDGCVDAVVTDPPYGMNKDFGNDSDRESNTLTLIEGMFPEITRLLRDGGMVYVFNSPRLIHKVIALGELAGLEYQRLLWMYKPNDCTFPWRGWLLTSEAIAVFSKGKPERWAGTDYCHDTYTFNHAGGELLKGYNHPSVKPLSVIKDLVKKSGDVILDPFLGSGTTAVACVETGRHFIGIELEAKYCEIARRRVAEATPSLFREGAH